MVTFRNIYDIKVNYMLHKIEEKKFDIPYERKVTYTGMHMSRGVEIHYTRYLF